MSDIALANGNLAPVCAVYALHYLDGRWPGATLPQARTAIVDAILTALKEGGYSTVELPEPHSVTDNTAGWPGDGWAVSRNVGKVLADRPKALDPDEARKFAAALLAAADKAEEGK